MTTSTEWKNKFHAADIVLIDTGERTLLPQEVLSENGKRGRISAVEVGYDVYETEDCVGRINTTWHRDEDIPNVQKGRSVILRAGTIARSCVETLIPDTLHKVYHYNILTGEEWFLFYRKRKYLYTVDVPVVHYPLFGEPVLKYVEQVVVEEEYLRKLGTLFDGTPFIEPLGFTGRLKHRWQER